MPDATETYLQTIIDPNLSSCGLCGLKSNACKGHARDGYHMTADYWSAFFGQGEGFNFDLFIFMNHYNDRREALCTYVETTLRNGGTFLESFGPTKPTELGDTLWNLQGTRRLDADGKISEYDRPFIAECWNPEYLADHIARRAFGFNMRIATWLES